MTNENPPRTSSGFTDPFGADVFTSSWERLGYRSCPGCGADIGVSTEGPWHLPEDDCRAIRKPYPGKEQ